MALRLLICICLVAIASCAQRWPRRFPRPPVHPPVRERFLQDLLLEATARSRELDLKVAAGLDPCHLSDSKVSLQVVDDQELTIGDLRKSFLVGLRRFDFFRQYVDVKNQRLTTVLFFRILEGSCYVTLEKKEPFQLDTLIPKVGLQITSHLAFEKDGIRVFNSTLFNILKPQLLVTPPSVSNPDIRIAISKAFLKSAISCITKEFLPVFEKGLNNALQNNTDAVEATKKKLTVLFHHYSSLVQKAAPKVVELVRQSNLPDIVEQSKFIHLNLTDGEIKVLSKPQLTSVSKDNRQDYDNLQMVFPRLVFLYKNHQRPVINQFLNIRYLLQVYRPKNSDDLKVVRGTVFSFYKQQLHQPPVIRKFNTRLMKIIVTVFQSALQTAFSDAL